MSPYGCNCFPLCDDCLAEQIAQLAGVAQSRGHTWAVAIARVVPIDRPWPHSERMRTIARRKVEDLTRDVRLTELLAEQCSIGAARYWDAMLDKQRNKLA